MVLEHLLLYLIRLSLHVCGSSCWELCLDGDSVLAYLVVYLPFVVHGVASWCFMLC